MIDPALHRELLQHLDRLSPDKQRRVLDFAQTLSEPMPFAIPGKDLLPFAGILDPEDAELMLQAIEEGCERVDTHE